MPIPYERLFLTGIGVADDRLPSRDVYPFTIPAIAGPRDLAFKQPVTFLVGENGTGKSTLLEAIAVAWGLNPEGALSPQRQLAFLSRMHDLVNDGAQFIIATHSPILMAYPDATIY